MTMQWQYNDRPRTDVSCAHTEPCNSSIMKFVRIAYAMRGETLFHQFWNVVSPVVFPPGEIFSLTRSVWNKAPPSQIFFFTGFWNIFLDQGGNFLPRRRCILGGRLYSITPARMSVHLTGGQWTACKYWMVRGLGHILHAKLINLFQ